MGSEPGEFVSSAEFVEPFSAGDGVGVWLGGNEEGVGKRGIGAPGFELSPEGGGVGAGGDPPGEAEASCAVPLVPLEPPLSELPEPGCGLFWASSWVGCWAIGSGAGASWLPVVPGWLEPPVGVEVAPVPVPPCPVGAA